MEAKILIVSQTHLCRNPRVLKESVALSEAGYQVTVLTAIYSDELLAEDLELLKSTRVDYEFYSDLRLLNPATFFSRLTRKIAEELNALFQIESKLSLGHNVGRLTKKCMQHRADLYIMHQELATVLGGDLIKKGRRVAYDFEDWYSEDLLDIARNKRPIKLLKQAEQTALLQGAFCYTTSGAMAAAIAGTAPRRPSVIYNTFATTEDKAVDLSPDEYIRLYWVSQTTGPGRGLEFFIAAMTASQFPWSLTLRGNVTAEYKTLLENCLSAKDRIIFESLLKNDEIMPDMANYDFGLALEPNSPPNKNLTISNKFFYYLGGGLPVIASDTLGHQEVGNKHPEMAFIYKNNDLPGLIQLLDRLGNNFKKGSSPSKALIMQTFEKYYSWNEESKKLVKLVDNTLDKP